jgi:hypothetical protein
VRAATCELRSAPQGARLMAACYHRNGVAIDWLAGRSSSRRALCAGATAAGRPVQPKSTRSPQTGQRSDPSRQTGRPGHVALLRGPSGSIPVPHEVITVAERCSVPCCQASFIPGLPPTAGPGSGWRPRNVCCGSPVRPLRASGPQRPPGPRSVSEARLVSRLGYRGLPAARNKWPQPCGAAIPQFARQRVRRAPPAISR